MIEASGHIKIGSIRMRASLKHRANFSQYHLLAAKNAAIVASNIEEKYKSIAPPQDDFALYLSQVSTAAICSVAALESNINEYLVDHEKRISELPVSFTPNVLKKYRKLKKDNILQQLFECSDVFLKYDIVSFIIKADLLPENKLIQEVRYLIRLRNAFTHFTPEWDNALSKHDSLRKSRKNRFSISPFSTTGSLFFPYQLGSSCAIWSCRVSNDFLEFFKSHIG